MTAGAVRAGALVAFVLAEGVAAHPRPPAIPDGIRAVGATAEASDGDAYTRGKALLAADDATGALAAFREALATAPASIDAMNGIGVAYDRLGRPDLARSFYRAGLALAPDSPALLNNLGYSLYLSGDFAGAIAPLRAAAASDDAAAATTAQATLAKLVTTTRTPMRQATAAVAVVVPPPARIETTSAGEQRLTFVPPAPAADAAAGLGDDAGATTVAAAWTAADDARLVARIRGEELAEADAAAAAMTAAHPVAAPGVGAPPAAPVALAHSETTPSHAASSAPFRAGSDHATAGFVVGDAPVTTTQRRVLTSAGIVATATTGGPRPRAQAAFDSDDAELNAFAARVRADAAAVSDRPSPVNRIAARFRA